MKGGDPYDPLMMVSPLIGIGWTGSRCASVRGPREDTMGGRDHCDDARRNVWHI